MDLLHVLLLVVGGLAAGTMNAIAGGGSLITFPSLIPESHDRHLRYGDRPAPALPSLHLTRVNGREAGRKDLGPRSLDALEIS